MLWGRGPRGRGPTYGAEGRGPRAEKNKYPEITCKNVINEILYQITVVLKITKRLTVLKESH